MNKDLEDKMKKTAERLGVSLDQMPRHIAIIMDGNGRWAEMRHLPRIAGHRQGVKTVQKIVEKSKGRIIKLGKPPMTIYRVAAGLLDQYIPTKKIRLVGVGASGFISAAEPVQMDIFDKPRTADGNWEKVDKILDRIDKKFGKAVVHRASLPKSPEKDPD